MIKLFDCHQHLIYRDHAGYAWTKGIAQLETGDFTIDDYRLLAQDVSGSLFMETGVDDADYRAEAHFAHKLSKNAANGIKGIITSIRPESDRAFDAWLEESLDLGVVGYRRILHDEDDDMSRSDTFRTNLRKIGTAGKTFDMCFLARQLPIAIELAQACDNAKLIVNHCGIPDIAKGEITAWRQNMTALSHMPHVFCKLSGIMAYCGDKIACYETIEPYVNHVLDCFGPSRIVWGSDWPVVNMADGLPQWIAVTKRILDILSPNEAKQIAHQTAETVYNCKL